MSAISYRLSAVSFGMLAFGCGSAGFFGGASSRLAKEMKKN
jgi:hypothetical protein